MRGAKCPKSGGGATSLRLHAERLAISSVDRIADRLSREAGGRPVVIAGPTASGKSALGLAIALRTGGAVINADALQVWSCWRILTARPSPEDERAARHLLYGHLAPGSPYSAGHWLREAAPFLMAPYGSPPVIVGGTGLYLTALTEGLADVPPIPEAVREEADARIAAEGARALADELDLATAARIDLANPARVQRAWEVLRATGRGLAEWQGEGGPPLLPQGAALKVVIDADRDWLAARIERRFDAMLAQGALDEVRAILPRWQPSAPWARAIGARELVAYLEGSIGLDAAAERAKAATRQYAKRQRTWFRARMRDWQAIAPPDALFFPG